MESKHTPEEILNLPFDVKYLDNAEYKPDPPGHEYYHEPSYAQAIIDWQQAEGLVIFENIHVSYESCDCGDGYGCSHGSYPSEVSIRGGGEINRDLEFAFEDDGFYIDYKNKQISIRKMSEMTMREFIQCLDIMEVPYKLKPEFVLPSREAEMLEALEKLTSRIKEINGWVLEPEYKAAMSVIRKAKGGKQ